jgi:hypothetical protein
MLGLMLRQSRSVALRGITSATRKRKPVEQAQCTNLKSTTDPASSTVAAPQQNSTAADVQMFTQIDSWKRERGLMNLTAPHCECLKPAILLAVTKDGPNKGQPFWGCADYSVGNDESRGCRFFRWVNEASVAPPDAKPTAASDVPMCKCNEPAIALHVKKPGANQGRKFYRCGKGLSINGTLDEPCCDYFEWAERLSQRRTGTTAVPTPLCKCGVASLQLRVSKQGVNVGRVSALAFDVLRVNSS